MKYTALKVSYISRFDNVILDNIYTSEDGKCHDYGVIKHSHAEHIHNLNEYLQKNKPKKNMRMCNIGENGLFKVKFGTHYGKPRYKARKMNGLPTVSECLQDDIDTKGGGLLVDLVIKVDGYVYDYSGDECHVVLQCHELYMKE